MTKLSQNNWTHTPEHEDFDAAANYLSLLLPEDTVRRAVQRLRHGPMVVRRAEDLLRASGLNDLPSDNPTVAKQLKALKHGKLLSPVLCIRGDLHSGADMVIADGYHRVCASYILDEAADIPCRLAELPRPEETLAAAVVSSNHGGDG
jgi:hypothetical protein